MKIKLTRDCKDLKELLDLTKAKIEVIADARIKEYNEDLAAYNANKSKWYFLMSGQREPKVEYYKNYYMAQENVCINVVKLVTMLLEEKIDEVVLDQKDLVKLDICKRNTYEA